MQFRSDSQPPKRQYISPYQIFYYEQLKVLLNKGIDIVGIGCQIQKSWLDLTSVMYEYYENQFEQYEDKFQEQIIHFYGNNNHKDINQLNELKNVLSKPKRPLTPQLEYLIKNRYRYTSNKINWKQCFTLLMVEYNKQSQNVREQLEYNYERQMIDYIEAIQNWNEKYTKKYQTQQNNSIEINKKQKVENDFEYQQLQFVRPLRKLRAYKQEEYTQSVIKNFKKNDMKNGNLGFQEITTNIEQLEEENFQEEQKQTKKTRKF